MSNMTIYEKLNFINNNTNLIKQILVDSGLLTADEATLENLPIIIQELTKQQENPYQQLYMQRTANETNMVGLFACTPASTTLDLSMMNTSKVTDMTRMFSECKTPYLDLSGFDVSNVTTMERMFHYCTSEINIDGWDTSKLTNATYMFSFSACSIDISKLDFSNVTNVTYMFNNANTDRIILTGPGFPKITSFERVFYQASGTTLDLSSWDITNITDLNNFLGFAGYKTIDLTGWKTTKVTNMNSIFYYLSSLEKLIMPDWDMTNTTNTSNFIYNCSKLNYIDLSRSNDTTIAKIATLVPAKTLATYGQILIPVDSSQANIEALAAKYWKPVGPRIDMTSTELALELDEIKPGKSTKLCYGNSEPWYGNDVNVEYVSSDESVATIDKNTMTITSTGVEGTVNITARIADTQEVISEPKILSISETDNYPNVIKFRGTSTPTSSNQIEVNGTTVRLTNTDMDYNPITGIYTYDAGTPITRIRFNKQSNNSYANTCTEVIKINTSNVTNMSSMFSYCSNLTAISGISDWDTSNVTTMEGMFSYCSNLTELDLSGWDTSNATGMNSMGSMFYSCVNLEILNISNFDMTNVTSTWVMFDKCNKLHTLRLDNCNNTTISKIVKISYLPTNAIEGVTRKIYCKQENAANLIPPTNWIFEYVD